jgi:hypothetical protein
MPVVGIDGAEADGNPPRGEGGGGGRRQGAAREWIFGEPQAGEAVTIGALRQFDADARRHPAMQPHPEPRQIAAHTPPGRGRSLTGEKCTCTTRQSPSSLRNTIVARDTNCRP